MKTTIAGPSRQRELSQVVIPRVDLSYLRDLDGFFSRLKDLLILRNTIDGLESKRSLINILSGKPKTTGECYNDLRLYSSTFVGKISLGYSFDISKIDAFFESLDQVNGIKIGFITKWNSAQIFMSDEMGEEFLLEFSFAYSRIGHTNVDELVLYKNRGEYFDCVFNMGLNYNNGFIDIFSHLKGRDFFDSMKISPSSIGEDKILRTIDGEHVRPKPSTLGNIRLINKILSNLYILLGQTNGIKIN